MAAAWESEGKNVGNPSETVEYKIYREILYIFRSIQNIIFRTFCDQKYGALHV